MDTVAGVGRAEVVLTGHFRQVGEGAGGPSSAFRFQFALSRFGEAAFFVGGFTSILAGYLGMRIAVYTNVRTTKECAEDIHKGFVVAYRGGEVLGFVLVGLALLVL